MSAMLLRDKQVAERLSIGKSTVWKFVKDGRLPKPYKFGAISVWKSDEIDAVIAGLERSAA